jgi:hypothetical protein
MEKHPWTEHLGFLKESLLAQVIRARRGSEHPTIKGSSIEEALRRLLRQYLPSVYHIGTGQVANYQVSDSTMKNISPQIDILIYERTTFPHLAVNEDGSVVICCEPLFATVECKTKWNRQNVLKNFIQLKNVESKRYGKFFGADENFSGYFVFIIDTLKKPKLTGFEDKNRFVGIYTLEGEKCWRSPFQSSTFSTHKGNSLEYFIKDILEDSMRKDFPELGNLEDTREVVKKYFGWDKR